MQTTEILCSMKREKDEEREENDEEKDDDAKEVLRAFSLKDVTGKRRFCCFLAVISASFPGLERTPTHTHTPARRYTQAAWYPGREPHGGLLTRQPQTIQHQCRLYANEQTGHG